MRIGDIPVTLLGFLFGLFKIDVRQTIRIMLTKTMKIRIRITDFKWLLKKALTDRD
jgi:hypothetical protein